MATHRHGLVYGVAALRAAARGDRMMWALHRAALSNGIVPVVPAPVVAEGFRTEVRGDYLRAMLAGSEVEVLEEDGAERLGELAARAERATWSAPRWPTARPAAMRPSWPAGSTP